MLFLPDNAEYYIHNKFHARKARFGYFSAMLLLFSLPKKKIKKKKNHLSCWKKGNIKLFLFYFNTKQDGRCTFFLYIS